MAQRANIPTTDFLDHLCNVGITGRLATERMRHFSGVTVAPAGHGALGPVQQLNQTT